MKSQTSISFCIFSDISYDQRMLRICGALQEEGYDVMVYSRNATSDGYIFNCKNIECKSTTGILAYMEYNIKLFFALWQDQSKIICAVDLDTILPTFIISTLKNKIAVYDAHEYFVESPELDGRNMVQWVWRIIARLTIPKIKYKYTVNKALAFVLARRYGGEWGVVRNVPRLSSKHELNDAKNIGEQKIILYQGVINVGRGLEEMIDAMTLLPWARLLIAGDGDILHDLKRQVQEKGLENQVKFLGKLKPQDLLTITKQAWVGINLLNTENLNYYYSLANKYFDYMQAAVPCISMNTEVYRSINDVHNTAILVDDLERDTLVKVFDDLYIDQNKYKLLHSNCKKAALIYHWDNEKQGLVKIYRSIESTL